ncbi:MAG TPA: ThuA domain-containing protein [Chthoniobacteraceae bacterium]|jgi:type 1 glutamine amidotransferase|nr:hypothetical protein [Chthoniobacter sp.]HEV7867034.1 ThuA domain-containing protein [Chthoniobacteraceae bacterium]
MIRPLHVLFLVTSLATATSLMAAEAKKVLVVTVTTGFRHSSIPTAEKVLQKLATESKAFTIVDFARQPEVQVVKKPSAPKKPGELKANADEKAKAKYENDLKKFTSEEAKYQEAVAKWTAADDERAKASQQEFDAQLKASMEKLSPANLAKYDGVIFANTTGDLPLPDREGFIKWVEDGHALMGMHSASDTFHNFKPYIEMLGGEFATHGAQVGVDLKKKDAKHPGTAGLPETWTIKKEEMYEFKNYDPARVRDLWILDQHPQSRAPGHYGVSWVRTQGKGKVFYTSLGHREDVWDDSADLKGRENPPETAKQFQQHILGGIKWALGLAE